MRRLLVLVAVVAAASAVAVDHVAAGDTILAIRTKPQWFPDSKRLLYDAIVDSVSEGNTGFVATSTVGGAERTLFAAGVHGSLSPDGTRLAVIALRFASQATTLELLASDGTGARAIGDAGKVTPAWAPDGRSLVYATVNGRMALLDLGSNTSSDLGPGNFVSWAPDGTHLVVESGNPPTLTVVGLDGSRLALGAGADAQWSPDGRWIAFDRGSGADIDTWLVRPDGSQAHLLRAHTVAPAWAPDSSRVAAVLRDAGSLAGGDPGAAVPDAGELGVVAVDGTTQPLGVLATAERPAWSPDGTRIAFTAATALGAGIDVVAATGSGLAAATAGTGCVPPAAAALVGCSSSGGYSVPAGSATAPLKIRVTAGAVRGGRVALKVSVRDAHGYRVRAAELRVDARGATPRPVTPTTTWDGAAAVSLAARGRFPKTLRVVLSVGGARLTVGCRELRAC